MRCSLGRELPATGYIVGTRPKIVRYWLMAPEAETPFEPNDETDELRWLAPDEAMQLLSYDRDRELLAAGARPTGWRAAARRRRGRAAPT